MNIENLRAEILAVRDCGEVTGAIEARPDFPTEIALALDEFVARYGFSGLGTGWREIEAPGALEIAREILFRDLAHGVQMTTPANALELATRFLDHFEPQARFFTNGVFESGGLSSWYPISQATFDTGILVLGGQHIGILWVEDED